jgi:hypothetical protein|tara:strand:- start:1543 stop:1749 length:207 start_codon:yes stop_codon:yes gene_type:complete
MSYGLLGGLLGYKYTKNESGFMASLIFVKIISITLGMHSVNGDHIVTGICIGPMELSFTLHRWLKWIP